MVGKELVTLAMIEKDLIYDYIKLFMPLIIALSIIFGVCIFAIVGAIIAEKLGKTGKLKQFFHWIFSSTKRIVVSCVVVALILGAGIGTPLIVKGVKSKNGDDEQSLVVEKQIISLNIESKPSKTNYIEGEALDLTGMVVKATFDDGTTKQVTNYQTSIEAGTALGIDDTSFTISIGDVFTICNLYVKKAFHLNITETGLYRVEAETLYDDNWIPQPGREGMMYEKVPGGQSPITASADGFIGSINIGSIVSFKIKTDKKYNISIKSKMAKYEDEYSLRNNGIAYFNDEELTITEGAYGHTSDNPYTNWKTVDFGKAVAKEGSNEFKINFNKGPGPNIDYFDIVVEDYIEFEEKTIATPDNTDGKLFKVNGNYVEIDRSATSMFAAYTKRVIFYIYNSLTADKDKDSLGYLVLRKENNKYYLSDSDYSTSLELLGEPGNLYFEKNNSQSLETFENLILKVVGNQISTLENIYFAAKVISDKEYVEENKYVYKDSDISNIASINHEFTFDTVKIDAPPTNSNPFYYNSSNGYLEIDRNVGSKSMFNAYTNYVRVDLYNSSSATIGDDSLGYFIMESITGNPMLDQMNSGVLLTSDRTMSTPIHGGSGNVFTNSQFGDTLQAFVDHEVGASTDLGTIYISVKVIGGNYVRVSESKFAVGLDSDFSSLYKLYI